MTSRDCGWHSDSPGQAAEQHKLAIEIKTDHIAGGKERRQCSRPSLAGVGAATLVFSVAHGAASRQNWRSQRFRSVGRVKTKHMKLLLFQAAEQVTKTRSAMISDWIILRR